MRKIYTGIDLGSDSVKIVVAELVNEKFQVLSACSTKSLGIKRGLVVDHEMALRSLNQGIFEIEKKLGIKIDRAIVTVPSNNRDIKVVTGSIVTNGVVVGKDVVRVLQEACTDKIDDDQVPVSVIPIMFNSDKDKFTKDPVGMTMDELTVKALLATAPKKQVFDYLSIFNEANIEVEDITFNCIGDYFEAKNKKTEESVGAIINIGNDKTDVSVFNKGILIKNKIFNLGSRNVDNDITYIFGTDNNTSREIKEKFALASKKYADSLETMECETTEGEKKIINQLEVTEVVEARLVELLKLAKKEINDLTNRKISYIIITGGISELPLFNYIVEDVFEPGLNAKVLNITTMGIRNNKYSSAIGIIKYFDSKMRLREKNISLIDEEKIKIIEDNKNIADLEDSTLIGKVFEYFSDN